MRKSPKQGTNCASCGVKKLPHVICPSCGNYAGRSIVEKKNSRTCSNLRIGVDLMGSDRSPQVLFDAVVQAAKQLDPSVELIVFTNKECGAHFAGLIPKTSAAKIEFFFAPDIIHMRDEPLAAVRHKKNSSLVMGVKLLKKRSSTLLSRLATPAL